MKKVEYLDLELSSHNRRLSINKNNFRCNFEETFTHQLHSEHNPQLNSIIDYQINFAENIKKDIDKISNLFISSIDHLRNNRSIIKEQDKKLDYIQDQCSSILQKRIDLNLEKFPTMLEIETLISATNQIAKQIEQINQIQDNLKQKLEILEQLVRS